MAEPSAPHGRPAGLDPAWRQSLTTAAAQAGLDLVLLSSIPSTNGLGRAVVVDYFDDERMPPRFLLAAWEQTAGRGRHGRTWSSPPGCGVYATWVEPLADAAARERLPLTVPVALAEGLRELLPRAFMLKWPNDLMVEGRKIGGILIDVLDRRGVGAAALVGFGVNHSHPRSALPEQPSITLAELGEPPALGEVSRRLVDRLRRAFVAPAAMEELVRRYRELSLHRPGDRLTVRVGEERLAGEFVGFDAAGRLRLNAPDGERLIAAGEVYGR